MEDKKTSTNLKKNKEGYGYKYTELAEIHRYLENIDARYIQRIERIDGDDYVFTKRCFNNEWENDWLQGCRVVNAVLQGIKNPAQEQGSALTYARRYSLLMAFGLATEDDDAQSLSRPKEEIKTKEQAENYKLTFGKYAGKTIKEIVETQKDYANWLYKNGDETVKICLGLMIGD